MSKILELTYEECETLLRAGVFGRFVLTRPTGPEIVPVNYVVVGNAVLVRTTPGSLLDRYAEGTAVVFEVDRAVYGRWHGWSVVARGRAGRSRRRSSPTTSAACRAHLDGSPATGSHGSGCGGSLSPGVGSARAGAPWRRCRYGGRATTSADELAVGGPRRRAPDHRARGAGCATCGCTSRKNRSPTMPPGSTSSPSRGRRLTTTSTRYSARREWSVAARSGAPRAGRPVR